MHLFCHRSSPPQVQIYDRWHHTKTLFAWNWQVKWHRQEKEIFSKDVSHFFNWATLRLRLFLILLSRMKVFTDIAIMEISLQNFDFSRIFFCKGSKPSAGSIFTSLQLIINCDNVASILSNWFKSVRKFVTFFLVEFSLKKNQFLMKWKVSFCQSI